MWRSDRFVGFCWPKKASEPCDVVISSFGGTESPFLFFLALFSVKQLIVPCVLNSSLCVSCTCTSVPVCGCEGVTMVPLSLLEIRNCPINNLSMISSVSFSDKNWFFIHKTFDFLLPDFLRPDFPELVENVLHMPLFLQQQSPAFVAFAYKSNYNKL